MIRKEMNDAMNQQIVEEMHSGYIYLGISRWAKERSMHHYSSWMAQQAKEEFEHAKKFMEYLTDTNGHVTLGTIEAVKTDFANTEETIQISIDHEKFITGKIHELMDLAQSTKDYESVNLLMWFIKEQIEEEAQAMELMASFKLQGMKDGIWDHHLKRD